MQSKRQLIREISDITQRLDHISRTALVLGAELYALDPDNALFVGEHIEPGALAEMKRLAKAKPAVRQDPGAAGDAILARRRPWYVRLWAWLNRPL